MGDPIAAGGAPAQGAGGVYSACCGSHRGGGRAYGGLKPEVKVTIGGVKRLGGVVMLLPSRICVVNFLLPTRSTSSRCISQIKVEETRCS